MRLVAPPRARTGIVFVHPSDEMYGADRVLLNIYDALDEDQRAAAEFWLPTDLEHGHHPLCEQLELRGATVRHLDLPILRRSHRTPRHLYGMARQIVRVLSELRRARPDTVYCTTSAAFLAAPVARLCGVPHIVGHVQEIWGRADYRVLGLLGLACDRLVAISGPVAASTGRLVDRVRIVPNATAAPVQPRELGERHGPLTFLVASRWNGWKGHRTLLESWERAGCPGRLVVLGGKPLAGEVTDVEALRERLSDPRSVEIVGEVPDVGAFLRDVDVMVVPSDRPEPFGLVATEAFANGRPVVASAGGGLLDIVTDGRDGWLYPLGDVEALAGILSSLDRETVTSAGARARQTYLDRFTPERFADRWQEALKGLPKLGEHR